MPSLTFSASLTGPAPVAPSVSLTYHGHTHLGRLELTGAQTYDVDLAMMPAAGLKGLLVELDTKDAAGATVTDAVSVRWTSNSVQKSEELSPGGFFALCSPTPVNGITALSIISTANAIVRLTALG